MLDRIRDAFHKDFPRSLFYTALAFLALAIAFRVLFPPWVYFGSAQRGYYKMNRLTGETYVLYGRTATKVIYRK